MHLRAILLVGLPFFAAIASAQRAQPRRYCAGDYTSSLAAVDRAAAQLERSTRYTFCLRSTAVYQCLYYDPDGRIRRTRKTSTAHGTGFAFRGSGNVTYLMSNEHVTDWPAVTTKEKTVDGVPQGCKRVSETQTIVDNENDNYTKDDVRLKRIVSDVELDVSILKAQMKAPRIPFTLGQSAGLTAGIAVQVRGFPLGKFQALSTGKVINPRDHDDEGQWDHLDFVVDAPLSSGNSGSPVLALSCKTGKHVLLGIFHAAYRGGSGLNVVVGIDELREMMTTLKPRKKRRAAVTLSAQHRKQLLSRFKLDMMTPIFPFGGRTVGIRVAGHRLLYDIFSKGYPLADYRSAVIEDLPARGFGRLGRIWFGSESGLRERAFSQLSAHEQTMMVDLLGRLRLHFHRVLRYRALQAEAKRARAAHEQLRALERQMSRGKSRRRLAMRRLSEVAERYAPGPAKIGLPLRVTRLPLGPVRVRPPAGRRRDEHPHRPSTARRASAPPQRKGKRPR